MTFPRAGKAEMMATARFAIPPTLFSDLSDAVLEYARASVRDGDLFFGLALADNVTPNGIIKPRERSQWAVQSV